jgi:single-strand DNA-binding protein
MSDINCTILIGRIVRDAELKYTNYGTAISKISIAVNRSIKRNDAWVDEVSFFDITIWGKTAEGLNQYLKKGIQIGVQGELIQNRWTDKEGKAHSKVEINAENIRLLGSKQKSDSRESKPEDNWKPSASASGQGVDDPNNFTDDIPF